MKNLLFVAVLALGGCTPGLTIIEKHLDNDSDAVGIYIQGWGPGFWATGRGVIMIGKADQNCHCTVQVGHEGVAVWRVSDPKSAPAHMSAEMAP